MKRISGSALALALALCCSPAHSRSPGDAPMLWLTAEVEISPAGQITDLQWKNPREVAASVTSRIEPHVRAWRFDPGKINGVAQTTRTHLRIQLLGEPRGNTVALRFGQVSTGAMFSSLAPPVYPHAAARMNADAVVVAHVAVAEDGQVTVESVDYRGNRPKFRKHFVAATEALITNGSFAPERVGGRPLAVHMQVPVSFCMTQPDCEKKYPAHPDSAVTEPIGPPSQPIALDSAVRLIDAVAGSAL
jgi:hypothetical protein